MSLNHCPELPVLTVLQDDNVGVNPATTDTAAADLVEINPIAVGLFSNHGKPLEADYRNLSTVPDRQLVAETIRDAACDELAVVIWPKNGNSPLLPATNLLREMVNQYLLDRLPDTLFMRNWVKAAKTLICDYNDIDELLAFEEPQPTPPADSESEFDEQ